MNRNNQKILDYYNSVGSKLGYKYLTREIKHFGFYPLNKRTINEQKAQELMQDLIYKKLQFKSGDLILDAGCGYGTVACYLVRKYGGKITGIDINPREILRAGERAKELGLTNRVKFKVMNYSQTDFLSNYFNHIYTMETLSHASNIKHTLKEFYRVLQPGGKIVLFEYTLAPNREFSPWEMKMLELGIEGTAVSGLKQFRHNQFPKTLQEAGFKKVHEQNITENFKPSIQRLKNIAKIPYFFIKLFNLQKHFSNILIAAEWSKFVEKDLWRYCIFTAQKPYNKK